MKYSLIGLTSGEWIGYYIIFHIHNSSFLSMSWVIGECYCEALSINFTEFGWIWAALYPSKRHLAASVFCHIFREDWSSIATESRACSYITLPPPFFTSDCHLFRGFSLLLSAIILVQVDLNFIDLFLSLVTGLVTLVICPWSEIALCLPANATLAFVHLLVGFLSIISFSGPKLQPPSVASVILAFLK